MKRKIEELMARLGCWRRGHEYQVDQNLFADTTDMRCTRCGKEWLAEVVFPEYRGTIEPRLEFRDGRLREDLYFQGRCIVSVAYNRHDAIRWGSTIIREAEKLARYVKKNPESKKRGAA